MNLQELIEKHQLSEDAQADLAKVVQGAEDKLRTDYSKQIKELEKFKPTEKSEIEVELEATKAQLKDYEFKANLSKLGVPSDLANYLKSDIDFDEFQRFYQGFQTNQKDYIPKSHQKDVGITKEQFQKMGIGDRTKLYNENPSLYETLTK